MMKKKVDRKRGTSLINLLHCVYEAIWKIQSRAKAPCIWLPQQQLVVRFIGACGLPELREQILNGQLPLVFP